MKKILFILVLVSVKSFAQTKSSYYYQIPKQRNDGLQTASLSEAGIDSGRIIDLTNKILADRYVNIHSLLILRNNKLVYENYFGGQDEVISFAGTDVRRTWNGSVSLLNNPMDSLHDVRSVSKSVVSACIGIAIAQGKIKDEEQNIWDYFPEYRELKSGMKSSITIKDLLTMTSGLDVNERVSYMDSANTERQTNHSPDPIRFILSRQSINPPGTIWNYSGGCTELLGAVIKKVSGREVDEYAAEYIFKPLGIRDFSWVKLPSTQTSKGAPAAASGLRLTSRDMVKFGLLYVNKGEWKNTRIISSDWIERTLQFYFTAVEDPETFYGYQFWGANVIVSGSKVNAYAAMGKGGQIILIIPSLELVVVVTAGNYSTGLDQSYDMIADGIYPAIEIKGAKRSRD
jgi:CubicO group peptidase (beta-lactamase class C family)